MQRNQYRTLLMCVSVAVVLAAGCARKSGEGEDRGVMSELNTRNKQLGDGSDHPNSVVYPVVGHDSDTLACAVVQIVPLASGDQDGPNPLARITQKFGDIRVDGKKLWDEDWPHVDRSLKVFTEACSGVVYENRSTILTAAHCADRLLTNDSESLYVIAKRTACSDAVKTSYKRHRVKWATRYLSYKKGKKTDLDHDLDLMVLELEEEIKWSCPKQIAAKPVKKGERVTAQFHPFGLPQMRSTPALVVECGETQCTAQLDNGTGGSGGLLVNKQGEIVGVIQGNVYHEPRYGTSSYKLSSRPQPFTHASMLKSPKYPDNIGSPRCLPLMPNNRGVKPCPS